jgi:oligopeptide transport system substrate-binding protein
MMPRSRRFPLGLIAIAAGVLLVAGIAVFLGPPAGASRRPSRWFGSSTPPKDNILRWNNGAEPELTDPGVAVGAPDGNVCRMLWEGLTVNHPETLEPLPGMAERWEMSDDGLVYTFHLRKAVWSDGHPVTAGDFVWSWQRVLAPETASRYAGLLYYLKNGEEYNKGTITDPSLVGVVAPDDSTLIVTLKTPTAYWIHLTNF